MLLSLSIKNYALIEHLEVTFSNQFSIITGETGAGKSILLGALGLVLGNRADLSTLKDDQQKCVIEAQFLLSNYNLKTFFAQNDIDFEEFTIIRREILPTGKSRAFVNDSPVTLQVLQELSTYLIDIHSQNETRELVNEEYQMEVLDIVANNAALMDDYLSDLNSLKKIRKELNELVSEKETIIKEQEYNLYLLEELESVELIHGTQEIFEKELEALNNVEFIGENIARILAIANQDQIGILSLINEMKAAFNKIEGFSSNYKELSERFLSNSIELQDIINETHNASEKIVNDPERLSLIQSKLQQIYFLQKKHQVTTLEELIKIKEQLIAKVDKIDHLEQTILNLQNAATNQLEKVEKTAFKISENRKIAAPVLSEKVGLLITQLGMPDAKFVFQIQDLDTFSTTGKNSVEVLFSANRGMSLGPIKKVASGGEIARIMLALKSVLAMYSSLPTIIFDEIDSGVSGEMAIKMGEIMQEMSKKRQVFAITHLPQIAAKGNQHYKVFKYNVGETTISELKLLSENDRIIEIAEMLSGKEISESALIHAKTLLN